MRSETVAIESISPDPANLRKHGTRNLQAIMTSLVKYGQQRPIVATHDRIVRRGNGVYLGAKELGWTHLNVVWSDLAGVEATAYAIASNRTAELAKWNKPVLVASLQTLKDAGFDLEATGFTEGELTAMQDLAPPSGAVRGDSAPAGTGQPLKFNMIFDTVEQQARWFAFIAFLNRHEGLGGGTLPARLDVYLQNGGYAGS
jgi:hypothetical protein